MKTGPVIKGPGIKAWLAFFVCLTLVIGCVAIGPVLVVESSHLQTGSRAGVGKVYFADTAYVKLSVRNLSVLPVTGVAPIHFYYDNNPNRRIRAVLTFPEVAGQYDFFQEDDDEDPRPRLMDMRIVTKHDRMYPLEKRHVADLRLEFPPLEGMRMPFWQEVRRKLEENDRLSGKLTISWESLRGWGRGYTLTKTIPVELCARKYMGPEYAQLEHWLETTPESLLPVYDLKNRRRYMTRQGWEMILAEKDTGPPAFFRKEKPEFGMLKTRITRKPVYPNAPATVEGWQELEQAFSTSTLRDEIRLRGMILEQVPREDIREWLKTLPPAQRSIMAKDFGL